MLHQLYGFFIVRLSIVLFVFSIQTTSAASIMHTSISCDKTDFLLKVSFNETFTGLIYTEQGSPNCVYVNASIQKSAHYQIKIPLAGCETRRNSDGNLENEIVIQNGESFRVGVDRKFLLTCIPAAPKFRDSAVTVSFGGVTIDQATTAISVEGKPQLDYTVTVIDANSPDEKPLKRPLSVGDKVTYSVRIASPTRARIGRCWASDGASSLELSDKDGCSIQKSGDVWNDFEVKEDDKGTVYLNHIKAWAFPTSNEVNIFCNLHVCTSCEQTKCSARRRRAHSDSSRSSNDNELAPLDYRLIGDEMSGDDMAPPIPIHATLRLKREKVELQTTDTLLSSSRNLFVYTCYVLVLLCLL